MSPVVPHAVFLACLFIGGYAEARERPVTAAVVHEAAIDGDRVRWDTRIFDCAEQGSLPRSLTTELPVERAGTTVRFRAPIVQKGPVEVVLFADPSLVFVPGEALSPHRTRHGFEVFRPDQAARDEVVRCLRDKGVRLPPAALIVGTNADMPPPTLEGMFVRRQEGARTVLAVSAVLLAAAVGASAVAWRRLVRRVRFEAAEAILKADLPDL
jgi:hypothetical protein